jgi:hypothetical protein
MLGAALAGLPRLAAACPTCISTGFGDRTYTWAYLGLLLMPFVVAVAIAATLAWYAGWRLKHLTDRIPAWISRRQLSPRTHTETP